MLSELWSLKCQKWLIFCIFYWFQQIISHNLEKIFSCIWKILFSSFRKCYGLLDSELPLGRYQPLKVQSFITFLLTRQFFDISILNNLRTLTPKPIHFLKELKKIFQVHLNVLPTLRLMFCCHQQKNTKNEAYFDILMTITMGVNMITRKITPFSHLLLNLH